MDIEAKLAEELSVRKAQVHAAVTLLDEGNTVPFIARYRKEATGSLDDEVLRALVERLTYLRNLEERKATVLSSIEEQGKLTDALRAEILAAETQVAVEDLYRPYRPKRRTRGMIAREKGLSPLAELIRGKEIAGTLREAAEGYIDAEKGVESAEDAIAGAKDILAEEISDDAAYRAYIREATFEEGTLKSAAKDKDKEKSAVYEMYFDFEEALKKLPGHRILAVNRGEAEGVLAVTVVAPEERILRYLRKQVGADGSGEAAEALSEAAEDAYRRLIAPSIENEVRRELKEKAEDGAIKVFGKNLEQLLMQPPIEGKVVLGWDPAFRTGCKLAVVDETGKVLDTTVIYPTEPQKKVAESVAVVKRLIQKYGITLISLGNGTASRESEQIISDMLKEVPGDVRYVIVSEAGASVYSASKLATEEFPEFDVGQRSAASMARRLQDPLAELVKIDPKSIGVGQYQHDCDQKKLGEALGGVVESCVNRVGVDLNTASAALMEYVSGISKPVAKNIVKYREEHGRFTSRQELLKVARLGPKAFEQCAGFMRISGGSEPLDRTAVHPESYEAARGLLSSLGLSPEDIASGNVKGLSKKVPDTARAAETLGIGEPTLVDILKELEKPARDPREDMPRPILRSDVLELKDLVPGMVLKGTVRNVIDFGAFVDIGVHQDGLVHISEMTDRFIQHPLEAVSVGDVVEVRVLSVDLQRQRIQLSMLPEGAKKGQRERKAEGKSQSTAKKGGKPKEKQKQERQAKGPKRGNLTIGDLVGGIRLG